MSSVDEKLTHQFYSWELRGRGWQIFDTPVLPEPPFRQFHGHYLPAAPAIDDGRRATRLSSFVESFRRHPADDAAPPNDIPPEDEEPAAEPFERTELVELKITLPPGLDLSREVFEQFLFSLGSCRDPISFEIVAVADTIAVQFAASPSDAPVIRTYLQAYFPLATVTVQEKRFAALWSELRDRQPLIAEFGLDREFMIPLVSRRSDFLVAIIGALSELGDDEAGVFQVVFSPVQSPWAESLLRAVSDDEGKPFFSNRPELLASAKAKAARPLYAAVVRAAASTDDPERSLQLVSQISSILASLGDPTGNAFIPLDSAAYPEVDHEDDLLRRQSRRPGVILNSNELLLIVHLPPPEVQTPKLLRETNKTRALPSSLHSDTGILIGSNVHAGRTAELRLTPEQRVRHVHIVGVPGSGKSTLLFNMIRQDIEGGAGVALLDPHGDLADNVLGAIPVSRVSDVIFVDPADADYSVGFNVLAAASEFEKTLLASDLVSVFQRLSTSWGDQMNSVLQNAILAFIESEIGGTLSDLRRFLLDPAYRAEFLKTVRDPEIVYYWQKAFPQLGGNRSIGPILTRLETFLSQKLIRAMVSQPINRLDFGEMMDTRKIFIAKLSQGLIGRENAYLLGSLFVSKLQQAAMARQSRAQQARRDFWIFIDEFHHFITPSMAEILTGARKYRVGLTLAHQELGQLRRDDDVARAVLSTHTRIVFRVNDADSRVLGEGLVNFEAKDLRNLEIGSAICRVERSDFDFNLRVPSPVQSMLSGEPAARNEVVAASRSKYAALRADIEKSVYVPIATPVESRKQQPRDAPAPPVLAVPESVKDDQPAAAAPEADVAPVEVASQPATPKPLGKGGHKHTYLQQFIKQWAQGRGYLAVIEEPLAAGGQVDVSLRKPQRTIACEISITTPNANEIENVRKCIAAGYEFVALLSPDAKRIAGLERAIVPTLTESEQAKVRFFSTPDALFSFIEELDAKDSNREKTVRGYRVKMSHQIIDKTSKEDRTKMLAKIVAESLKRTKT